MSAVVKRYFWCDAPSPLHEAKGQAFARAEAKRKVAASLAERVGAESFASNRDDLIRGFVFSSGSPPEGGGIQWKKLGHTREGEAYWMPKRNTKTGRQLFAEIAAFRGVNVADEILRASDLLIATFAEPYMYWSTAGWRDGRIFVSIPQGGSGDPFPAIPDYLTECEKWEVDRWFDLGRQGVEGGNDRIEGAAP